MVKETKNWRSDLRILHLCPEKIMTRDQRRSDEEIEKSPERLARSL